MTAPQPVATLALFALVGLFAVVELETPGALGPLAALLTAVIVLVEAGARAGPERATVATGRLLVLAGWTSVLGATYMQGVQDTLLANGTSRHHAHGSLFVMVAAALAAVVGLPLLWFYASARLARAPSVPKLQRLSLGLIATMTGTSLLAVAQLPAAGPAAADWLAAQRTVASASPLASSERSATSASDPIDHDLWLQRGCNQQRCQLALSRTEGPPLVYAAPRDGLEGPPTLSAHAALRIVWLDGPRRWFVRARGVHGEDLGAVAFDGATLRPTSLALREVRSSVGPARTTWLMAYASPLAALAAWLLARRGRTAPLPHAIDALHEGQGVVTLAGERLHLALAQGEAALHALPVGPVVLEFADEAATHFRTARALRVRRALPGTLGQWQREQALSPLLPWLAASTAGSGALSSLLGWVY